MGNYVEMVKKKFIKVIIIKNDELDNKKKTVVRSRVFIYILFFLSPVCHFKATPTTLFLIIINHYEEELHFCRAVTLHADDNPS